MRVGLAGGDASLTLKGESTGTRLRNSDKPILDVGINVLTLTLRNGTI